MAAPVVWGVWGRGQEVVSELGERVTVTSRVVVVTVVVVANLTNDATD